MIAEKQKIKKSFQINNLLFFVVALLPFLITSSSIFASSNKPLLFLGDKDYPPYEWLEESTPTGLNVDICRELSKAIGREIKVELMQWKTAQEKVLKGEADGLIELAISEERRKQYDVTETTIEFSYSLFVRSDNVVISEVSDVEGKKAGVTAGGYPRRVLEKNPKIDLVFVKNYLEGFEYLKSGKIDALGADRWVAPYLIQKHGIKGITVTGDPFFKIKGAFAVKKGNTKLLNEIGAGIKKLIKDGTLDRLKKKWSRKEIIFLTQEKLQRIYIIVTILCLGILSGFLLLWNFTLKKQIRKRDKAEAELQQAHDNLEHRVKGRTFDLEKVNKALQSEIAERKQAEEALLKERDKARSYLDIAGVIIVILNADQTVALINKKGCELLGFEESEVIGTKWFDNFIPERNRKKARTVFFEMVAGDIEPIEYFENYVITKDNTEKLIAWHNTVFQDEKGNIVATLSSGEDITKSKQVEAALLESEERYRQLYTQSEQQNQALTALNAISKTVNQSLELDQVLQESLDRVIDVLKADTGLIRLLDNKTNELALIAHQGYSDLEIKGIISRRKFGEGSAWRCVQSGKPIIITAPSKGSTIFKDCNLHMSVIIPLNTKDQIVGVLALQHRASIDFQPEDIDLLINIGNQVGTAIENARLYQDKELTIKELKETQEQLQQSQKMEAIGTLAGGIAHDFNNILSPIMIHSEMAMIDLPPDSSIQFHLKEIFQAGKRARDMVKQILAFSRKSEQEHIPVKLSLIVKEALKLLRYSLPSTIEIKQNIEVKSDTVWADPAQINQVVMNLATNAAHAMRAKGGVLEVSLVDQHIDGAALDQFPDLNPGAYIKLTVKDTGPGITPEVMDRIFEPYYTTKEVGEGTGMGLAVVHGIVKNHGGDITCESEPGKGTTFHILLPLLESEVSPVTGRETYLPKGIERILFVDDEKAAVNAVQPMLEILGYKVAARTSSIEALEAFRNNPDAFDLVITDMTMPNMTGKDLAKELMSIRSDIPIILCTGFSEQIDENKAIVMGVSAFVMKPIVMREIANTIRNVLDNKQ